MMLKKPIESISVRKAVKYNKLRYCTAHLLVARVLMSQPSTVQNAFFPTCPLNECVRIRQKTQMQRNVGLTQEVYKCKKSIHHRKAVMVEQTNWVTKPMTESIFSFIIYSGLYFIASILPKKNQGKIREHLAWYQTTFLSDEILSRRNCTVKGFFLTCLQHCQRVITITHSVYQ